MSRKVSIRLSVIAKLVRQKAYSNALIDYSRDMYSIAHLHQESETKCEVLLYYPV